MVRRKRAQGTLALCFLTACNALLGNERAVFDPALDPAENKLPEAGPDIDAEAEVAPEAGRPDAPTPDACSTLSCGTNAHCDPTPSARCVCNEGFAGDGSSCSEEDLCRELACQHGGRCMRDAGGARCDCAGTGFEGSTCQTGRDLCAPNPCVHGTCAAEGGIASCTCEAGFRGPLCDEVDRCVDNPCGNRGRCSPETDVALCACNPGWEGELCNVSSCNRLSCKNGTECVKPSAKVGFCYPTKCAALTGLCLAANRDGTGRTSSELLTEANETFDFNEGSRTDNDWRNVASYFAYVRQHGNFKVACVYPDEDYKGTPLRIELGSRQLTTKPYGKSNRFTTGGACPVQ